MKRLTVYVSGKIQNAGYRTRVIDIARAFGLKGTIQNLIDGRVKVTAEGEEADLERFLKVIDIKNTVIYVSSISKEYSEATGDFESFYKLVEPGEADSWLDQGVVVLKEILGAIKEMNADIKEVKGDLKERKGDIKEMKGDIKEMKGDMKAVRENTALISQISENTKPIPQILEEIKGVREEIHPGLAVQLRQVQEDIKAIKERLGMP